MGSRNAPYAYSADSPISFVDESGLSPAKPRAPDNLRSRLAGSRAHRDILPELARRINVEFGPFYEAHIESRTLPGGSPRSHKLSATGSVDLLIHATAGGWHVYDLKPFLTSQKYKWQLTNYVYFLNTDLNLDKRFGRLSAQIGTVLERMQRFDPKAFKEVMAPIPSVSKPGRIYFIDFARDTATGNILPGFIEYTYKDLPLHYIPAPEPVPQPVRKLSETQKGPSPSGINKSVAAKSLLGIGTGYVVYKIIRTIVAGLATGGLGGLVSAVVP